MYDFRRILFNSYLAYIFFLPIVFIILLFNYKTFSNFLVSVIIIDTILFVTVLISLYALHAKQKRLWVYIIFFIVMILISIRNLYLFISIIYRTANDFEKQEAIFSDATSRQVGFF